MVRTPVGGQTKVCIAQNLPLKIASNGCWGKNIRNMTNSDLLCFPSTTPPLGLLSSLTNSTGNRVERRLRQHRDTTKVRAMVSPEKRTHRKNTSEPKPKLTPGKVLHHRQVKHLNREWVDSQQKANTEVRTGFHLPTRSSFVKKAGNALDILREELYAQQVK